MMKLWPKAGLVLVGGTILIYASPWPTVPHLPLRPWQLAQWGALATHLHLLSHPVLDEDHSYNPVWPSLSQRLWLPWPFLGAEEVRTMRQEIWLPSSCPSRLGNTTQRTGEVLCSPLGQKTEESQNINPSLIFPLIFWGSVVPCGLFRDDCVAKHHTMEPGQLRNVPGSLCLNFSRRHLMWLFSLPVLQCVVAL